MFQKAEKKKVKLKLALTGPSGAGKTYSALLLAKGLGGKTALVDTENASASLYADRFDFDSLNIDPPYTVAKYVEAIKGAVKLGYDNLVIDSLTHAWAGDGGLLSKKEAMDSRGGNSFTNWSSITKEHEQFISAILASNINIIASMRSKQDYVLEVNDKGKSSPKKVGMAPIQREGMEYLFTTVFDIAMDHSAQASKDRTGMFADQIFRITEQTGKDIKAWLLNGKDAPLMEKDPSAPKATLKQVSKPDTIEAGRLEALSDLIADEMAKINDSKLRDKVATSLMAAGDSVPELERIYNKLTSKS